MNSIKNDLPRAVLSTEGNELPWIKARNEAISEKVIDSAKTRCDVADVKKAVKVIMDAVDALNTLSEHNVSLTGLPLSEIKIPEWSKAWVYPKRVSLEATPEFPDLVKRLRLNSEYVVDPVAIAKSAIYLAARMREEPSMIKMSEARAEVTTISQVHYSVKGRTRRMGEEWFITTPLIDSVEPIVDGALNEDTSRVEMRYITDVFKISK